MFSEFSVRAQQWRDFATAHSRGLRPVGCKRFASLITLPQRIRAGCDAVHSLQRRVNVLLCHSAFVRVATKFKTRKNQRGGLCHSAFVRVATSKFADASRAFFFATAHSCGLRLMRTFEHASSAIFATAHSCGLRLFAPVPV